MKLLQADVVKVGDMNINVRYISRHWYNIKSADHFIVGVMVVEGGDQCIVQESFGEEDHAIAKIAEITERIRGCYTE